MRMPPMRVVRSLCRGACRQQRRAAETKRDPWEVTAGELRTIASGVAAAPNLEKLAAALPGDVGWGTEALAAAVKKLMYFWADRRDILKNDLFVSVAVEVLDRAGYVVEVFETRIVISTLRLGALVAKHHAQRLRSATLRALMGELEARKLDEMPHMQKDLIILLKHTAPSQTLRQRLLRCLRHEATAGRQKLLAALALFAANLDEDVWQEPAFARTIMREGLGALQPAELLQFGHRFRKRDPVLLTLWTEEAAMRHGGGLRESELLRAAQLFVAQGRDVPMQLLPTHLYEYGLENSLASLRMHELAQRCFLRLVRKTVVHEPAAVALIRLMELQLNEVFPEAWPWGMCLAALRLLQSVNAHSEAQALRAAELLEKRLALVAEGALLQDSDRYVLFMGAPALVHSGLADTPAFSGTMRYLSELGEVKAVNACCTTLGMAVARGVVPSRDMCVIFEGALCKVVKVLVVRCEALFAALEVFAAAGYTPSALAESIDEAFESGTRLHGDFDTFERFRKLCARVGLGQQAARWLPKHVHQTDPTMYMPGTMAFHLNEAPEHFSG